MTLFGRRCSVQVDRLLIEGLTVSFTIEMDVRNFGKAEIKIYNLNAEHRHQLEKSASVDVELSAGYLDHPLERLCKTTLRDVYSEWTQPNWVTTLRTGDGDKASKIRISRAYSPEISMEKVWKDLLDKLKGSIDIGNAVEAFKKGGFANGVKELLHGGNVHGQVMDELRRIGAGAGLDVGIQDGALLVTPVGEPLATSAVVLSASTGLIGSPQPGAKKELKCRALILPGLRPKRKVEIKSELVTGVYVVQKARYTGNTAGNDWYADLTCKEIE
jgi:hypothetical protein